MNVGSVCRAMKNFGLSRLAIVRPGCELGIEARKMALTAQDILEGANIVETIAEAVEGSHLVLGTSNRTGGDYHEPNMTLQEGVAKVGRVLPEGEISILFGREEWGLTKEDLANCQGVIRIVTDPAFTSMNLAQAVLLVSYELYQAFGVKPPKVRHHAGNPYEEPPTFEELARLYKHMTSVLSNCEYLPKTNPDGLFQVIRAFISRAEAKRREVNILMGIFSNVDGFMRVYVRGQKGRKPRTQL